MIFLIINLLTFEQRSQNNGKVTFLWWQQLVASVIYNGWWQCVKVR